MTEKAVWRNCGTCKQGIGFDTAYYACEISTCQKTVYCSMDCFTAHVPVFRHKDAWAEQRMSPKSETRRVVGSASIKEPEPIKEVLVVASKLKAYIHTRSGMNTSASVMDRLSDMIRIACDKAIEHARAEGRKTVMDRDFY